ncbi:hypothetical protein HanHA89_Chr14g0541671 [Helianthus annuus]|nr:hypothetical protein HanHA89_Chr14g0541671 [Helianthus annuus]
MSEWGRSNLLALILDMEWVFMGARSELFESGFCGFGGNWIYDEPFGEILR